MWVTEKSESKAFETFTVCSLYKNVQNMESFSFITIEMSEYVKRQYAQIISV